MIIKGFWPIASTFKQFFFTFFRAAIKVGKNFTQELWLLDLVKFICKFFRWVTTKGLAYPNRFGCLQKEFSMLFQYSETYILFFFSWTSIYQLYSYSLGKWIANSWQDNFVFLKVYKICLQKKCPLFSESKKNVKQILYQVTWKEPEKCSCYSY